MNRPVVKWLGVLLVVSASGCYIPTWRCQTPRPLQAMENRWGDLVDCIGNHDPVNQPWCNPHYARIGIYRNAPYGQAPIVGPPPAPIAGPPPAPIVGPPPAPIVGPPPAPLPGAPIPAPLEAPDLYLKP